MPGQGPRDSGISGHDNKARATDRPERTGNGPARLRVAAGVGLTGYLSSTILSHAQDLPTAGLGVLPNMTFGASEVIQIATFTGVMGAAMLSAIWLIRERGRIAAENLVLRERIAELNAAVQRAEAMLTTKDQRTVVWAGDRHKPDLVGTLTAAPGVPDERSSFLAFGRWLTARSAAMLDNAIAALREAGTSFDLVVEAQSGTLLEVLGRRSTSHAIVRFVSLTRRQTAHAALKAEHAALAADHEAVLALVASLDMPFWLRSETGRLRTVNAAYAAAVEAGTPEAAVAEGRELLATQARENIARQHVTEATLRRNLPAVVDGDRKLYAVTSVCANGVVAGLAVDKSDLEALRAEYERTIKSHAKRWISSRPRSRSMTLTRSCASSTRLFKNCGSSTTPSWKPGPTTPCSSTACAVRASSPSSRNGGAGRKTCCRPTGPWSPRNIGGTSRTDERSASWPAPIPRAV